MTDDSITIPYNGCGTNVDQSDGRISFTNQITGDDRAVMIDNIIVGEKLSLGVSCQFDDTFTLTAGEFAVGPADFLLGSQGNIGYVSVFFNYFHDVPSTFLPVKFFGHMWPNFSDHVYLGLPLLQQFFVHIFFLNFIN